MAIRIKLHGLDIETDSPAEAVEMYRQLAKMNGRTEHSASAPESTPPSIPSTITLGPNAKAMIKLLLAKGSAGERNEVVAHDLGVKSAHGTAAVTRQIRAWGKSRFQLTDEQCVRRILKSDKDGMVQSYLLLGDPLASKVRGHEKELLG